MVTLIELTSCLLIKLDAPPSSECFIMVMAMKWISKLVFVVMRRTSKLKIQEIQNLGYTRESDIREPTFCSAL